MIKYHSGLTGGSLRSIQSPWEVHLKSLRRDFLKIGQGRSGGVRVPEVGQRVVKNEFDFFENVKKWISDMVEYDVRRLPPDTLRLRKRL